MRGVDSEDAVFVARNTTANSHGKDSSAAEIDVKLVSAENDEDDLGDIEDLEDDREQLYELHARDQLSECQFSPFNVIKPGERFAMIRPYTQYITLAAQSAFVLCPSGNNPETFRLREALEVGAIPLMIRPKIAHRNFLNRKSSLPLCLFNDVERSF